MTGLEDTSLRQALEMMTIDDRPTCTFANVVRLLEAGLGWRLEFVADADFGASHISAISQRSLDDSECGGYRSCLTPPGAVLIEPVIMASGEQSGRLFCYENDGVAFGQVGPRVLHALAGVIASEIDVRIEQSFALDAERTAMQTVIDYELIRTVFQPIVDARSLRTVGAEALTRFVGYAGSPAAWFARAERVGLGPELELLCARQALAHLDRLPVDVFMSVNASPSLLGDDRFVRLFDGRCSRIVVEITEHESIDADGLLSDNLRGLRSRGARIAIDDTGAGYAGLERLIAVQPDIVKLDRSLIRGIDSDIARTALCEAMVGFCSATGAQLLAEGVETQAEFNRVADVGVDIVQGYLFAHPAPLPLPEITAAAEHRRNRRSARTERVQWAPVLG